MNKILLYQWCSPRADAILRLLPKAMPEHVIDVTDYGYFQLHRRRLASASGECEAKLAAMLEQQTALLDQHERVVCYGTPAFFIAWAEAAGGLRVNGALKERARALLTRFDVIYLPDLQDSDTERGKHRTMELGIPAAEEALQGSGTALQRVSDFIEHLEGMGYGL